MDPGVPDNEAERLAALRRYQVLDTQAEQAYDDITRLAAYIAQVPIALISLVDEDRQWFKSKIGMAISETPREIAFCAHAILNPDRPLIVPDAKADARFSQNPLVTDSRIRFYAGEPLVTADRHALGTLCIMDHTPRELNKEQFEALAALSRLVVAQLELRRHAAQLREAAAIQDAALAQLQAYQKQLEAANARLEEKSLTDKLTGVANRAGFDQRLNEEIARSKRYGAIFSLLLLDVDRFKNYNDSHGHIAGDEALAAAAKAMQKICRPIDFIARYGGEEFAVILPATDRQGAYQMGERLRQEIAATPIASGAITVSIGASTFGSGIEGARQLIVEADKALYEAKGAGRNRVMHADSLA
jgi:diguanylate cyclase (GGDEF)-like protein